MSFRSGPNPGLCAQGIAINAPLLSVSYASEMALNFCELERLSCSLPLTCLRTQDTA